MPTAENDVASVPLPPKSVATPEPRPQRSIGVMVASSLVSACCGVILTFAVPKLLSVDDFGAWRTFLLYAGYAGLLHLGLIDGALLLWSRHTSAEGASAPPASTPLGRALRFITVEQLLLAALAALAFLAPIPRPLQLLLLALAVYALLFNLVGLLQVYLQSKFKFAAVAFGMSAPGVLFVLSIGVFAATHISLSRVFFGYIAGWTITLAVLLWIARKPAERAIAPAETSPSAQPAPPQSAWSYGLTCIATGWPIVLANTGFGLMQSADRVTVNLTRPLHDFALYSFSQSTIYVPITILAAVSRVAFSWFARAHVTSRAGLYRSSTRLLSLLWMVLLASFFVVGLVVEHFLPRYLPALGPGRILLVSVLFLSLVQIVQLNTFSLQGRQRQSLFLSIAAVALAFATAWFASKSIGTLEAVAWSQVLSAGLWWLVNEWCLRDLKLFARRDILHVLAVFLLSLAALFLASAGAMPWAIRLALYYAIVAVPAFLLFRPEFRSGWDRIAKPQSRFRAKA